MIGPLETLCRLCGVEEETGAHLVFRYEQNYGLRPWDWISWEELDDHKK